VNFVLKKLFRIGVTMQKCINFRIEQFVFIKKLIIFKGNSKKLTFDLLYIFFKTNVFMLNTNRMLTVYIYICMYICSFIFIL